MNRPVIGIAVTALVCTFALPALAQPDPATMIKMCDSNGDNAVTQQEWDACGAPTPYPAAADANHDGKVSVSEMAASEGSKPDTGKQTKPDATDTH